MDDAGVAVGVNRLLRNEKNPPPPPEEGAPVPRLLNRFVKPEERLFELSFRLVRFVDADVETSPRLARDSLNLVTY